MKLLMLTLAGVFVLSQTALANGASEKKLFTLEKSLNSENILLIHTQTDKDCKFISNTNEYVDFYWLMDKANKKNVHSMIRSKVKERVQFVGINDTRNSFKVRLNDLSEIRHDLENNTIEAHSEINNGVCDVKSIIQLGASAKYKKLNLQRTYCEVDKNMLGVPTGCKYLELSGTDVATGEKLSVRFKGK